MFFLPYGLNSSKWQQALVDKGLATYAGVSYQTCKYVGPVQTFIVPDPQKLKECYEEAMKQIKMWGDDNYITDDQLQTAIDNLRRNKIRNEEKPSSFHTILHSGGAAHHWTIQTIIPAICRK